MSGQLSIFRNTDTGRDADGERDRRRRCNISDTGRWECIVVNACKTQLDPYVPFIYLGDLEIPEDKREKHWYPAHSQINVIRAYMCTDMIPIPIQTCWHALDDRHCSVASFLSNCAWVGVPGDTRWCVACMQGCRMCVAHARIR